MEIDPSRYLRALLLAPLSAGLGLTIAFADSNMMISDFFISSFALIFITYPFALFGIVLLGLPAFLFLKKIRCLNFLSLSFIGLPLGYLSAVITGDLTDPVWLKIVCIVSPTISTTAALLMLKKPNKFKNENAESSSDASSTRPF